MKKMVLILLALAIFIASTGFLAHATIDIYDTPTAEIPIVVRIGFDPTDSGDPNDPLLPINPDNWIAVTVPERIALVSDGSATSAHTTLVDVDHPVINRSVHAVTVSIEEFDLAPSLVAHHFTSLNLIAEHTTVPIIDNHALSVLTRTPLFRLNGTCIDGLGNVEDGEVSRHFNFSGTLTPPTAGTAATGSGSITLHFSSHGPVELIIPNNPHEKFEDPETGTVWRVLVPGDDPRGGIGNALIITEYVHMSGTRYHPTLGFTLFQSSEAQKSIQAWWNNPAIIGNTMRSIALDYEFQDASGDSITRSSTAAGAGIEVERGNGTENSPENIVGPNTNVTRGYTRPLSPRVGTPEPFILSISEANAYFSGATGAQGRQTGRIEALEINTMWWLRSPGNQPVQINSSRHSTVLENGQIASRHAAFFTDNEGFRPALWIRVD